MVTEVMSNGRAKCTDQVRNIAHIYRVSFNGFTSAVFAQTTDMLALSCDYGII